MTGTALSQFLTSDHWGIEALGNKGPNLLIVERFANPNVLHEYSIDGTHLNSMTLNHSGWMNTNGVDSDDSHIFAADNTDNPRLIEFDEHGNVVNETYLEIKANSLGYDRLSDTVFLGLVNNTVAQYDRSGDLLDTFSVSFVPGGLEVITAEVPTPSAVWLLGFGLIGIVGIRRKIKK